MDYFQNFTSLQDKVFQSVLAYVVVNFIGVAFSKILGPLRNTFHIYLDNYNLKLDT